MKLLSRFIWLIIGISAIVFAGISIVHFRADKELDLIKNSIKEEYSLQIDKVLTIERTDQFNYSYDISHSQTTNDFLLADVPMPETMEIFLDTMVMQHFNIDAVWFFKADGEPFHFYSPRNISEFLLDIYPDDLEHIFKNGTYNSFYINQGLRVFRILGEKVEQAGSTIGYVFSLTEYDNQIKTKLEHEVNNAIITIVSREDILPPITRKTIRIERMLISFDGETVGRINVELRLPFLILWQETSLIDNLLMIGALVLILALLLLTLTRWVIFPLRRISESLQKGNSGDIIPLLSSKTELGDVARMIGDYHVKTADLETSESMKRHIIDNAQVGILIIDAETYSILTANPYACSLINTTEDAIKGLLCSNFIGNENDESIIQDIEEVQNQEAFLTNAQGERIPILHTITQLLMNGKAVYMETFVDLSEIKQLQSALQEEKQKLSMAVTNSGLIFCEYNFKTKSIQLPAEWQFMLEGKHDDPGKNILENIQTGDIKNFREKIDLLQAGAIDTFTAEFRVKHPHREQVWLKASVLINSRSESSEPELLIGLFEEITERIIMQQELIRAKERAEESDRQKSAYLANMSHKVRTPMNAIVGFSNLLVEEDLTPEEKESYIGVIRRDTEQLLHLIDDIINIAKIDAEQLTVQKRAFNINKFTYQLADYYKTHDKTKEIKFSINNMLPDGKDLITNDADKLHMVMDSLLNNAFKFTTKGQIELGYYVNPVGQKLILYVKDSGIGIPEESKDKVFNRFYQVDMRTDGTGLGLTISKGIVQLIGGKLYFDSKEGEGSTFYVEIPMEEESK